MTKEEFIRIVQDEVTSYGNLPAKMKDEDLERLIKNQMDYLYMHYPALITIEHAIIPSTSFMCEDFATSRIVKLPPCVMAVHNFKEINNTNGFGVALYGGSTYAGGLPTLTGGGTLGHFNSDSLVFHTITWSMVDQLRAYRLSAIMFDYNYNTNELKVLGRTPRKDVFISVAIKIPLETALNDYWVRNWIIAHAKLHLARILGTFTVTLVGGTSVNVQYIENDAKEQISKCEEYFKGLNVPDSFVMFN